MKTIVSKALSKPGKSQAIRKVTARAVNTDLKSNKTGIIAEPINTKWFLKKIINHYKGWFQLQFNKNSEYDH